MGVDWDTLTDLGLWLTPGYRYARRGSERWIEEVVGADRRHAPRDGRFDFFSRELSCLLAGSSNDDLASMGAAVSGDVLFLPHYEPVSYVGDEDDYPFLLNVVTLMSLGPYSYNANMPSLQEISGMTVRESWDSWVEMNPHAARERHLENGQMVWVESPLGKVKTKLKYVEALRPDVVNLPHNQGHTGNRPLCQGSRRQRPDHHESRQRTLLRISLLYQHKSEGLSSMKQIGGNGRPLFAY